MLIMTESWITMLARQTVPYFMTSMCPDINAHTAFSLQDLSRDACVSMWLCPSLPGSVPRSKLCRVPCDRVLSFSFLFEFLRVDLNKADYHCYICVYGCQIDGLQTSFCLRVVFPYSLKSDGKDGKSEGGPGPFPRPESNWAHPGHGVSFHTSVPCCTRVSFYFDFE